MCFKILFYIIFLFFVSKKEILTAMNTFELLKDNRYLEKLEFFPEEFEKKLKDEFNEYVDKEHNDFIKNKNSIESSKDSEIGRTNSEIRDAMFQKNQANRAARGAVIGLVIGIWAGGITIALYGPIGILVWVALIVGCGLLGKLMDNSYVAKARDLEAKKIILEDSAKSRIESEQAASIRRCTKRKEEITSAIEKYNSEFDKAVKNESLKFVESPLVAGISDWLADIFSRNIDRADRGSHIETVDVDMEFYVKANEIVAIKNKNTNEKSDFNFNKHRYSSLDSSAKIAAAAKAIGQNLQMTLLEKYTQDVSGTPASIEVSGEDYSSGSAKITLWYKAVNDNYKPIQSW